MAAALTDLSNDPLATTSGIERYSVAVSGGTIYVTTLLNANGQVAGLAQSFVPTTTALPAVQLSTALNATTGSLPAGAITGAAQVSLISTNAVPGAQLVRTAAQMLADTPGGAIGLSWAFTITNTGAGTLTLTADAGSTVTLSGTMTVPQNTTRSFIGKFNTATTATITAVGVGTYS